LPTKKAKKVGKSHGTSMEFGGFGHIFDVTKPNKTITIEGLCFGLLVSHHPEMTQI